MLAVTVLRVRVLREEVVLVWVFGGEVSKERDQIMRTALSAAHPPTTILQICEELPSAGLDARALYRFFGISLRYGRPVRPRQQGWGVPPPRFLSQRDTP